MANPVKRIEKDFLFAEVFQHGLVIQCFVKGIEFAFTAGSIEKEQIVLHRVQSKTKQTLTSIFCKRMRCNFVFSYHQSVITFNAVILEVREDSIVISNPELLYKNLQRKFSRIQSKPELKIHISKNDNNYVLDYTRMQEIDSTALNNFVKNINSNNSDSLDTEHLAWFKQKCDGFEISMFKQSPPVSIEELAVSKLGKMLIIPQFEENFPAGAPYRNMLITAEELKQLIINNGNNNSEAESKLLSLRAECEKNKIYADCFIPLIFHTHIIGCIHAWINKGTEKLSFPQLIDKFSELSKIIVYSLERSKGFTENKQSAQGDLPAVLDISEGGFLAAFMLSTPDFSYKEGDNFAAEITAGTRVIRCMAKVVRLSQDWKNWYLGCKFTEMALEDMRFFFEYLYHRPFTDNDLEFISGSV